MASYEHVLVSGPSTLRELVDAVEQILGAVAEDHGEGFVLVADDSAIGVYDAAYVDEVGLPLSRYPFDLDVLGVDQVAVATRLGDTLHRTTMWDLLRLTDDGQKIAQTWTRSAA